MKILYLITKSNWGGAQKYVYELASHFSSKGHDVVVAYGGKGELEDRLTEAKIKTKQLDGLVRNINIFKELRSARGIYLLLKEEKPDIFHVNSSKAGGLGAFIGRMMRVPHIIYTVHGAPFREDRPKVVRALLYVFTYITCMLAHTVITVSRRDEHDIGGMPFMKKKTVMIYNGITFTGEIQKGEPKSRTTRIVTIGDLTKNKGYLYGLQAVDILVKKGYEITYTIEGEGEDRKKIEEFLAHNKLENVVVLLGRTLKTGGLLHNFDIFLLPSVKEGLPYVLLEAGRAMLPVVATITGGIPEIVRHEESGLLTQPKDVEALAQSLERYIKDKKLAKTMGQSLHSHVVQHFSFTKMIVETSRVYGLMDAAHKK